MTIPEWKEMGIPAGYGPKTILYNPPSRRVVVELRSVGDEYLPNRLYMRHEDDAEYHQIGFPEAEISYESPVVLLTQPTLFFNANRIVRSDNHVGGNWEAVHSFDLSTLELATCFEKKNILLPSPFSEGWVTALVSATEDGGHLYLRMGMREEERKHIRYALATIDLSTRAVVPITWLKGAFF